MSSEPTKPEAAAQEAGADDSHMEAPSSAANDVDPDAAEELLFGEKAILYRFDPSGKEWKERGQGTLKILKNPETGRCHLAMRRNNVFTVCANHFILPWMEIKPSPGNERAFMWSACDFADGHESHETLTAKFKNAEIAKQFKEAFDKAKAINKDLLPKEGEKKE